MTHIALAYVTIALSYALYTMVRVHKLRLDITAIRDRLFDVALETDSLNDPAYIAERRALKAIAWGAFSPTTRVLIHFLRMPAPQSRRPAAAHPLMRAAIEECTRDAAHAIVRSVFIGSLSGLLLGTAYMLIRGRVSAQRDAEQSAQSAIYCAATA